MLLHEGVDDQNGDGGNDDQRILHHFFQGFQAFLFRQFLLGQHAAGHIDGVLQQDVAQFKLQRETGAEFLYTGAVCMDSGGETLARRFTPPESLSYRQLLRGNEIVCSSVLLRRELLLAHPMAHSELHEDYICWLRILEEGLTARGLPEPLLRYRLAEKSKSRNKLRSAGTTWRSYACLGIPFLERCVCFAGYVIHSVKRYFL